MLRTQAAAAFAEVYSSWSMVSFVLKIETPPTPAVLPNLMSKVIAPLVLGATTLARGISTNSNPGGRSTKYVWAASVTVEVGSGGIRANSMAIHQVTLIHLVFGLGQVILKRLSLTISIFQIYLQTSLLVQRT